VPHPPSLAGLFTVHMRERTSPALWWSFPHYSCCYKLSPLQGYGGGVPPLLPSPAGLITYSSTGECSSPTLQSSGCPALFAKCLVFFKCLFIIQFGVFSLFSVGGGQSVQRAMLIWPRVVCGSTTCHLAHLVAYFSQAG
jgi:hypothetical protein